MANNRPGGTVGSIVSIELCVGGTYEIHPYGTSYTKAASFEDAYKFAMQEIPRHEGLADMFRESGYVHPGMTAREARREGPARAAASPEADAALAARSNAARATPQQSPQARAKTR